MTPADIIQTALPLTSMGIDPSSELGARLMACRLRLYWIDQGRDIPSVVRLTAPPIAFSTKCRREPCFAANLLFDAARRIHPGEVVTLRRAVVEEIEAILSSRLNVRTKQQVAA